MTPTRMKEHGWNPSMIRRLLGEPDVFATNSNHRNGPPMRLYDLSRIIAAEAGSDFHDLRRKAENRSAASFGAA